MVDSSERERVVHKNILKKEWMDKRTNERTNKQMNERTNEQVLVSGKERLSGSLQTKLQEKSNKMKSFDINLYIYSIYTRKAATSERHIWSFCC